MTVNGKMLKIITDVYGKVNRIDEETRKIYDYSGRDKTITYNAEIVDESGNGVGFWTNYTVRFDTILTVEERLRKWNNKLLLMYAGRVGFNANKNDKDRKLWNKYVEFIQENENAFFDKNGDFRRKFLISDKKINEALRVEEIKLKKEC